MQLLEDTHEGLRALVVFRRSVTDPPPDSTTAASRDEQQPA